MAVAPTLDELEFLTKFETRTVLELDVEVRQSRILIGTRAALFLEVNAVLARKPQLEAPRFFAQPKINQRAHAYWKGWDGWPRWKKKRKLPVTLLVSASLSA